MAVAALCDCLARKSLTLDLSRLNLSSLPEVLPDHIEVLNAYENELAVLPANLPATLSSLSISDNNLIELPGTLPENLTWLSVSCNLLASLPERMPEGLMNMNLYNNFLQALPDNLPSTLTRLDLNDNQLICLPDNLPASLRDLRVADNMLMYLPEQLPCALQYLDVRDNLLATFPPSIMDLPPQAHVNAEGNPLSERTLRELFSIANDRHYRGPQILFSLAVDRQRPAARSLCEAVADWLPPEQWSAFENETNAQAFCLFLDRLAQTKNTQENPAFREYVATWLRKLVTDEILREETFALAQESTSSCEDRVTLAFNAMQQVALVREVENGAWDSKLTALITTGREMFRLEQIEHIAREKVKSLRFVDEIEVYLAYQTALRRELQLSSVAELMRFCDHSGVTQQDINYALAEVRNKENGEFAGWLPGWAPWKSALQRLYPELIARLQNRHEAAFCQLFPRRLEEELTAAGVSTIPDAEAFVGKTIWDQMIHDQNIAITREVMLHRYLSEEWTPVSALDAVRELAAIAVISPPLAASIMQAETAKGESISSQLAVLTETGGMVPLVDAWVALLYLLYEHHQLSGEQVTSQLLPQGKGSGDKSLVYAIAGAAWSSGAATRLCALLAEIALNEKKLRARIVKGLSAEQAGGFRWLQLARPADFYKLAKRAEKFWPNEPAKALLRQSGLIPPHRELYRLASPKLEVCIEHEDGFASLQRKINSEVTIATMAAWEAKEKEKAAINRAKRAAFASVKER
ncbi:NEL-type E3 ubiquitin ligase domain-containing protein [Vagococcus sp. WN89Y]|uniref:NEL-type E3 ubiquitin ligase domain-containing protein n=1 Tax=Vagococcus sp. WN89Y TaxID=3457258 RepID=UPI003FCD7477